MEGVEIQMINVNPKVSVIMGVYNTANKEEIQKALISIKEQTFSKWECIICDDGSNDDTYEFLINFANDDKRFVIIQNNENKGLAYSLNNALSKAKGKYIIRQDVDDYSALDRFEKLYTYMEEHSDIDVLGSGMILYDEQGIWGNYKIRTLEAQKNDFLIGTVVAHPSVIMKAQSLRDCNGYRVSKETRRCEDYDLFMRMFSKGYKICNIKDELYFYKADRNGTKREFINVVNESIVRKKGFKLLGLGVKKYVYIMKPYIVFLTPKKIVGLIKKG